MATTRTYKPAGIRFTPSDMPRLGRKLSLVCGQCGATGRYEVGRVTIDPTVLSSKSRSLRDAVYFSGYFHCRQCGAPGPWDLASSAKVELLALTTAAAAKIGGSRITIGKFQLFDGTSHQTAALGEIHLKRLIDEKPDDYFVWNRLGNLFVHADQQEKAVEAFEKAVELNPQDVETHHSLADAYLDDADPARAVEHFHAVLRFARFYPHRERRDLLHALLQNSLEHLLNFHHESGGKIPLLPDFDSPEPSNKSDEPVVVHLMNLDLSDRNDFMRFVDTFLPEFARSTAPGMEPPRVHAAATQASSGWPDTDEVDRDPNVPEPFRRGTRIGRNDPCPCGSGSKFKRCCGATQRRDEHT